MCARFRSIFNKLIVFVSKYRYIMNKPFDLEQLFVFVFLLRLYRAEEETCPSSGCNFLSTSLFQNKISLTDSTPGKTSVLLDVHVNSIQDGFSIEDLPSCRQDFVGSGKEICKQYRGITFKTSINVDSNFNCVEFSWSNVGKDFEPEACIFMSNAKWYAAVELYNQHWPLEGAEIPMQPFVSQDCVDAPKVFGNILEPFWINTDGISVIADDTVPLYVSLNENQNGVLCLSSKASDQHYPEKNNDLRFTVCKDVNVRKALETVRKFVQLSPPVGYPDMRMIKSPIWSTWARYKIHIDQEKILAFADEIYKHGFSNSQLEIDDMFSSTYGDFDFDSKKFPDPKQMIESLKTKGFRVTVWITPFANLNSEAFHKGFAKGFWLKDRLGQVPALVKWWQGVGGIIDVTNIDAADWFVQRLEVMKHEYGVDSFKFDAGETTYFPSSYKTSVSITNPGEFTRKYVEMVALLGNMIEVRCGYRSQRHPVFLRMADKHSTWGFENGLRTLIPTALTMSIMGYPFVLPDMIGGNGYGGNFSTDVVLPERELYIRWLQISAFMPSMQFSFVPWDYDDEVVTIAQRMVKIHEEVVTPVILSLKEEVLSGQPIVRPLWWITPEDPETWTIDSEFLVGDQLLIAPIVEKNARSRSIFVPKGTWKDELRSTVIRGPTWLKGYRIDLEEVAFFRRTP